VPPTPDAKPMLQGMTACRVCDVIRAVAWRMLLVCSMPGGGRWQGWGGPPHLLLLWQGLQEIHFSSMH